jgi:hypothetical protein
MGQAEGGPPFLAVEVGVGYSDLSSVLTAVLRVSYRSGSGRQLQRVRVGGRVGAVGYRPTNTYY